MRPKSAPAGRKGGKDAKTAGIGNYPTNRVERRIWEVKRQLVQDQIDKEATERKEEWQRKAGKHKQQDGDVTARPQSASATFGTVGGAFVSPGKIRSKARPRSAAMASKAKEKNVNTREKAKIVQELLGSVAGNTLAATLMSKEVRRGAREERSDEALRIPCRRVR